MNPFATGIFDAAPLDLPSAKEQGDWLDHRSNSSSLIEGFGFYAFLVFLAMLLDHTLRPKDATAFWEASMAITPRLPIHSKIFQHFWEILVLRPKRDRSTSRGRPKDREEAGDYLEGGELCIEQWGFYDWRSRARRKELEIRWLMWTCPWAKSFQTFSLGIRLRWWRGSGWSTNEEAKRSSPRQVFDTRGCESGWHLL